MPANLISPGKKAWEQYIEKDVVDTRLVRPAVALSWQRCRDLHLDPHASLPFPDTARELERRIDEKENLIDIARPFMRDMGNLLSGSDFQIVLTDENGLLLEVVGDHHTQFRMRDAQLCPGANWNESTRGTNAIGTALVERAPVQISSWEHFREENHFLTCSAAPICDVDGRVIGVLDVSGDCRQMNPHTLGMVIAVVRAIENQLRLDRAKYELQVMARFSNLVMRRASDGLLAINQHGIVLDINARGGQILGINPALAKGATLDRLNLSSSPLLQVLQKGEEYENLQIVLDKSGKEVESTASPVRDEMGNIVGAVAFFRDTLRRTVTGKREPVFHSHRASFDDLVGESSAIQTAKEWATLASTCNSTVLLLGESGTGKELFASAIHRASSRSQSPFMAINCAAMPETLIESELFGYMDGSFTGAKKGGQAGKFELANGGTIFLDEIGEMSPAMQAKLLRVLQERTVQRIGSSHETNVDIRVIAATHRDLSRDVAEGRFREDLYYRIAVLEVRIPALRERIEDLPPLARCLMRRICMRLDRPPLDISSDCLRKLATYGWPGNVRELENVLERAVVSCRNSTYLETEGLQLPVAAPHRVREDEPSPQQAITKHVCSAGAQNPRLLRDVERTAIIEALNACNGNIKKTAARLGIARNTLYRKMEEYGLTTETIVR